MPTTKPQPDFVIRFTGKHVRPWIVPIRTLARALEAAQKLLGDEATEDNDLRLLDVRSGSAAYQISSTNQDHSVPTLRLAGQNIENPVNAEWNTEELNALKDLSAIAQSLNCEIEFRLPSTGRKFGDVLATIIPSTYQEISETAFIKGRTTILARIERVGGATRMGCAIRVPDQHYLVYCKVLNEKLVRDLGKCIYKQISVSGNAWWYKSNLKLKTIDIDHIQSFDQSITETIKRAKSLGSNWDKIKDVDSELRSIRKL